MRPIPEHIVGCDTLIATASATADGSVIFAKNSDRHPEECQQLKLYPAQDCAASDEVRCQYLSVPQIRHTYRVLGSQPFWLWGFEHGVNEHGVVIGNEAIWTRAPRQAVGLLGMDLIRLGLERGATAAEALHVMTALLEQYGQGGSPRHNDPQAACYDSSFLLADPREAWVLETSGRDWVARRVEGVYSVSNTPSVGTEFDAASIALRDRTGLDFARDLGDYAAYPQTSGQARCSRSRSLLQQRAGQIAVADMMTFLRDHGADAGEHDPASFGPTLCMHPGIGQTAASMIVHLRHDGFTAWCSLVTPCISVFLPFFIDVNVSALLGRGAGSFSSDSPWWRMKRLLDVASSDWAKWSPHIRAHWSDWQRSLLHEAREYEHAGHAEKSAWVSNNLAKVLAGLDELEQELGLSGCGEPLTTLAVDSDG